MVSSNTRQREEDGEQTAGQTQTTGTGRFVGGVQALLGVVMLLSGGSKLAGAETHVQHFEQWDYPQWFRGVTGLTEVGGAIGLLLGRRRSVLGVLGGTLITGTMMGAIYTHVVRVGESPSEARRPAALLTGALLVLGTHLRQLGDGHADAAEVSND
jgi:uncharacterized membrane protein YphA (DoxX/SURF4 family)